MCMSGLDPASPQPPALLQPPSASTWVFTHADATTAFSYSPSFPGVGRADPLRLTLQ